MTVFIAFDKRGVFNLKEGLAYKSALGLAPSHRSALPDHCSPSMAGGGSPTGSGGGAGGAFVPYSMTSVTGE